MVVAILFGAAMLGEPRYRRWVGWFGIASSSLTLTVILIVELFLSRATGDIVFAIGLMPTIVWLVCTGAVMLRLEPR